MTDDDVYIADRLEQEIMEKTAQLASLRKAQPAIEVRDYEFETDCGPTKLSTLFGDRSRLLVIHNMGQGCRYCTLWADGVNGVLHHLADAMSVALVSKDAPAIQQKIALDRGWRFRMASHGGGDYMTEQCNMAGYDNCPGCAVYEQRDRKIFRRARAPFGPGDLYSPVFHFLALAGIDQSEWTPQFAYWRRPQKLDDGGENILA